MNGIMMAELNFHDNNAYVDMPETSVIPENKTESNDYEATDSEKPVAAEDIKPEIIAKAMKLNGRAGRNFMGTLNMSVDSDLTENNLDQIDPEEESRACVLLLVLLFSLSIYVQQTDININSDVGRCVRVARALD